MTVVLHSQLISKKNMFLLNCQKEIPQKDSMLRRNHFQRTFGLVVHLKLARLFQLVVNRQEINQLEGQKCLDDQWIRPNQLLKKLK